MVEATANAKQQTQFSLQRMTRTEFLLAASRDGKHRNPHIRFLSTPLVDDTLRTGKIRGEELPLDLAKQIKKPGQFWNPQIIGFRIDGLPLGESVRHLGENDEVRMLVPEPFRNEASVVINGRTYLAAVIAPEWDLEIKKARGEGGRELITLTPISPQLVPFGEDYFKFAPQGDLLMPVEAASNGSRSGPSVNRVFIEQGYAGPFIKTRNLLGDSNWLIFGKTQGPTATVIIELQNR